MRIGGGIVVGVAGCVRCCLLLVGGWCVCVCVIGCWCVGLLMVVVGWCSVCARGCCGCWVLLAGGVGFDCWCVGLLLLLLLLLLLVGWLVGWFVCLTLLVAGTGPSLKTNECPANWHALNNLHQEPLGGAIQYLIGDRVPPG